MVNESGSLVAERTLKILLLFKDHSELTLSQITKMIDISKTSAYRLVTTLTNYGFLLKENNIYSLGPVLPLLSKNINTDIRAITKPFLERLSKSIGESIYLSVLTDKNQYMFIDGIASPQPLKYAVDLFQQMPIDAGSAAKAHLAFQSNDIEKTINALEIKQYTPDTQIEKSKLMSEIMEIKIRGYSISRGERYDGVVGISAPIFDIFEKAKAVLTIFIPKTRATDELINNYSIMLIDTVKEISKRII
ncbi:HTH-type transcriptional regulator KipR [Ureibacillus acetophenoni]